MAPAGDREGGREAPAAAGRHVLHVDAERGFSGGERQVLLLVDGLSRLGWQSRMVCPPDSELARRAAVLGVAVHPVPMRNEADVLAVLRLVGLFRRLAPDLVHLHTGRAAWLGGLAARWTGIPGVVTRRMDRPLAPGSPGRIACARLAQVVAAISPAVERQLLDAGVPPDRIACIPSAVDASALRPRRPRDVVRAELGVGSEEVLALCVAALVPRKGLDVLLEAVAALGDRRPVLRLAIAGGGPQEAALRARTAAAGVAGRVHFLGPRGDVGDLLGAADLFVLPSRREGLGVAALEAMACGVPVVATRVGGLGWAVEDGHSGRLVPPGDAGALAAALAGLAADPALRAAMGRAGAERARRLFSPQAMAQAYDRLYRRVLAPGRGRRAER